MRILLLTPYWSPVTGGVTKFVRNLRRHLELRGQEVRVVAMSGEPESGVEILRAKGPSLWLHVQRRMKEFRPDIVHVHGHWELLVPAIISKLRAPRTRVVFTFHTTTLIRGLRRHFFSVLLNRCDIVTAVSADTLARMSRRYGLRVPIARTPPGTEVPNGDAVKGDPLRDRLGIPSDAPVLVAISPLQYPRKVAGLAELVQAFPLILERHPRAHLIIVGDGILRPDVERLISELRIGERVHLVGALGDAGPALQLATVVCHISYQDELPFVVLEAMAYERALVCSPIGGIPEVVRDNEETLFVEGGPEAIAEKIVMVLSDTALRQRLASRAFERFRSGYTWKHAVEKVLAAYRLRGRKRVHISIDVEEDYHGLGRRFRGATEALPRILELLRKHRIPASAFVTAEIARCFPGLLEVLRSDQVEIGSHGRSHADPGFASLTLQDQTALLVESKEALSARGIDPLGFRGPNFRIDGSTIRALHRVSFRLDSSIVPGRRVRSTRESPRIDFRGAPLSPYRSDPANPVRIGPGPVVEVPVSSNPDLPGSPLGLGYLNSAGAEPMLRLIETYPVEDVTFLIHPWEAIDYGPGNGLPSWMRTGCRSDLSALDTFLHSLRQNHLPIKLADFLQSPLEPNGRWWATGVWIQSTPKPRVFFVTHVYRPIIGGVTTYVEKLADELRAKGFNVAVIRYPSLLARYEAAHPRFRWRKLFHGAFVGLASLRILAARLRDRRVLVHSHGANFCLLVAYLAKAMGSVGLHTFHSPLNNRSLLLQWLGPRLDALLYVSSATEALYEATNALSHPRTAVVPGGISLSGTPSAVPDVEKRSARRRLGVELDSFVAGYVGRITPEKGIDLAIDAMVRLRDAGERTALLIAGPVDGSPNARDYLSSLRDRIEAAHIVGRVRLLGALDGSALEDLYSASDCLVVPSRREEPAPTVVAEAFARGVPVVAASVGGLRTTIADGVTGFLFPAGSAKELADRLAILARQEELRTRLSSEARKWAEREGDVRNLARFHSRIYSVLTWEAGLS